MVSSERSHTRDAPATDERIHARKGSTGAMIASGIACLLALPWVLLPGAGAVAFFVFAVRLPFNSSVQYPFALALALLLLAFLMLMVCVRGAKSLHRLLTRPSYDRSVPPMLMLLLLYLLLSVALPNFLTRRERSPMEAAIGTTESIRAALAAYAADSRGNSFPGQVANWEELVRVVNPNGANLKNTVAEQGFDLRAYTAIDSDSDSIVEDYTMSFLVTGLPDTSMGRLILVSPSRIEKARP